MAGILANSASKTMLSGATAADKAVSGYVTGERITLSVTPTGTDYVWGQAVPAGSAIARSALTATDVASPTFIPDVAGAYVLTCVVDSTTTYVLRATVTRVVISTSQEALRLQPVADASVQAPPTGAAIYYSSDQSALAAKFSDDSIVTLDVTPV